jgi:hypothetical protein
VKTKTHFAFRADIWDDTGDSIVEHVAGDLPGSRGALASGAHYPATGHPGGA